MPDILTVIRLQADQYLQEGKKVEDQLRAIVQQEQAESKQVTVTNAELAKAAKERNALLTKEKQTLADLERLRKGAFTTKEIELYNSAISKTQKNIDTLKGTSGGIEKQNSVLGSSFTKLGGLIAAAFSVQQIIAFGSRAVDEFAKAEKAAFQLLGALNGNVSAQTRLLDLSKEFQQRFGIDDDIIVAQESFLAIQGRTETQIRKTIQAAIQLSAITGKELSAAVNELDGTFEGITGKLGKLDSRIKDLSASELRNGAAIDIINEKYAGFAEKGLEGVQGQLQSIQIETDQATKRLGESFAPIKLFFIEQKKDILDLFTTIVDGIKSFAGIATGSDEISRFRREQLSLALKAFDDFNDEKLNRLLAADKRELESSTNLGDKKRIILETEIEALEQLLLLRKQDADAAAKANLPDADELKKLRDARIQDAKETVSAQAALRKFALQSELDNITDEETLRKTAANKEIKDEQELNQVLRLIQIEEDVKRRNLLIEFGESTTDIDKKIADEIIANRKATEKEITDNVEEGFNERIQAIEEASAKELAVLNKKNLTNEDFEREKLLLTKRTLEAEVQEYIKAGKDISEILNRLTDINRALADDTKRRFQEVFSSVIGTAQDILNELNSLSQANSDAEIERINTRKDASLDAIDKEIAKLEEQHQKGRIGDTAFERNKQVLIEKRTAAEKNYDEQVRRQKRKQAEIDKQLAIFNVILNTAQSIAKVIGNPVLTALAIAAGAVQLAVAISTPIPQFKKGTKGKKDTGLALVGEQGPELAFLPTGAKVLPANRTQQYGQFIDAMFDNRLDDFIHRRYVEPALKNRESVNINFSDRNMIRELREIKNKDSIRIENLHELASMFEQPNLRRSI